ncbi:dihydrolipoyl dehydrogenase [Candidatus Heimdallarchaeota archaeon B3_Heim]|nr:MAG: dihydrolipoyl dehydrogenase [Candidatus Heimdallarchaeota archaeon B3_Heim]
METKETEVLVIGAGPGGYPAAIRAAQMGMKVILVEKGFIGGECLNWGCIPSKALISAASFFHKISHDAPKMGITVEGAKLDFSILQEWKMGIQNKLIKGIKQLLKGNGVTTIKGTAHFETPGIVKVILEDESQICIKYKDAILATGSAFISLPKFKIDEQAILSAKGLLSLKEVPQELAIIGGGVIGIELGTLFAKLGTSVSIIELLPEILPGVDTPIKRLLGMKAKQLGITIYTSTVATDYTVKKNGKINIKIKTKKGAQELSADKILLAIGKKAQTEDLDLSVLNIQLDEKGYLIVNEKQQTSTSGVYAVGDCTGPPFLAHRATKQGIVAAEVIAGLPSESDFQTIPIAIFTEPEVSYAGLSETQAKQAGFDVITGRAAFGTSARAMTHLAEDGYVKVIADKTTNQLLGVQIIGPDASDLISEVALALEMGATVEDLSLTVHPHPTLPEMIMEAADAALNKAIHQVTLVKAKK